MKRIIASMALAFCATTAIAEDEISITITGNTIGAEPIAIVPFGVGGTLPDTDVSAIIASNLERSGYFAPIPPADLPGDPHRAEEVNFRDWQTLGTAHLVIGSVEESLPGQYAVRFRLFDVLRAEQALGFQFDGGPSDLRRIAHKISDILFEHLTGIPGAFNTRIAYVTETKAADGSRYSLRVADSDGFGAQTVLESKQPVLSPAWSPDGGQLAYVSFEGRKVQVFTQNLVTGERKRIAAFPGLNGAPAWSPDGSQIALTLSKDGNAEIYVLQIGSDRLRRLTKNVGIDTEPAWSPDGSALVFTSDRSGKPQIYEMSAAGGEATRVTFEGDYNARASFSPDGTKLVLVHAVDGAFRIAVLDRKTGNLQMLSDSRLDESPSFAPNGSMILYATSDAGGASLAAVSIDGRVRQSLGVQQGEVREPAWSPYRPTN